ncbi:MAG: nitroreductase family protein [Firmicutes bacterium]|nr:nitroreductase family protein [Bacillota bacterium]
MEKALQLLHQRRSIRKFTEQPVSKEQIQRLLGAAMAAPTAHNRQHWHFVAVTKRELLDQLSEVHQYAKMLKQATLCIAVCGDRTHMFWEQDCAAATQNILLAATALGLGSVWLGIHPKPEAVQNVRRLLAIPDPYVPLSLIAIGHPAEEKAPAERYDENKIHYEQW